MSDSGPGSAVLGFIILAACVVGIITAFGFATSFKGTAPGDVCVIQEGGPFDGRSVKDVRQSGEGVSSIGIWNKQRCFPSTERNYIISADKSESDKGTVDFVEVPTIDAVNVRVEGQAIFRLNTDPDVLREFYTKFGVRTFDGKHPYEGNEGWVKFLKVQFRPVLDNALRESIGRFQCVALNNTCQYVQDAEKVVKGGSKRVNNTQAIEVAQRNIERNLVKNLNSTLGGEYFTNIRFRLRGVKFDPRVQDQITEAQTKRTEVATANLEAQRQVQEAKGKTKVANEQARQIRAKASGYANNPAQARIDQLRALCGEDGCTSLQVLGGGSTKILSGGK